MSDPDREHQANLATVERIRPQIRAVIARVELGRSKVSGGALSIRLTLDGKDLIWASPAEIRDYRRLTATIAPALGEHGFLVDEALPKGDKWKWAHLTSILGQQVDIPLRGAHAPVRRRLEKYLADQADSVQKQRTDEVREEFRNFAQRMVNKQRLSKKELSDLFHEEADLLLVRDVLES